MTKITGFERTIDEIEGDHDVAWLRGAAKLSWSYTKDGKTSSQSCRSIDLLVLRRDGSGSWRVVRQIWNTPPE